LETTLILVLTDNTGTFVSTTVNKNAFILCSEIFTVFIQKMAMHWKPVVHKLLVIVPLNQIRPNYPNLNI
jgi:hypothetical protein